MGDVGLDAGDRERKADKLHRSLHPFQRFASPAKKRLENLRCGPISYQLAKSLIQRNILEPVPSQTAHICPKADRPRPRNQFSYAK